MADDNVIVRFWRGIDEHDWDLLASTLADNFERHGMFGTEADTCRGKANYLRFVSGVIGRMEHHSLKARKIFFSADGRQAMAECTETIRTEGEDDPRKPNRHLTKLHVLRPCLPAASARSIPSPRSQSLRVTEAHKSRHGRRKIVLSPR